MNEDKIKSLMVEANISICKSVGLIPQPNGTVSTFSRPAEDIIKEVSDIVNTLVINAYEVGMDDNQAGIERLFGLMKDGGLG